MTSGITDPPRAAPTRLDELAPLTLIERTDGGIPKIAEWLRRQQETGAAILWLDAEGGDDADAFFQRLESSLVQAGIVSAGLTAAASPGLPGTAWLGVAAALERVAERLIVVIENADRLDSFGVARQLCALLDTTSALHIVACARNPSPLSAAASRYRVRTVTVTATV